MTTVNQLLEQAQQRQAQRKSNVKPPKAHEIESQAIAAAFGVLDKGTRNMTEADLTMEQVTELVKAVIAENQLNIHRIITWLPDPGRMHILKTGAGPYVVYITAKELPIRDTDKYQDITVSLYLNNDYHGNDD